MLLYFKRFPNDDNVGIKTKYLYYYFILHVEKLFFWGGLALVTYIKKLIFF